MATPRMLLAAALLVCGTAAALTACTPADSGSTVAAASAAARADEGADDLLDEDDGFLFEEDDEEAYSPVGPTGGASSASAASPDEASGGASAASPDEASGGASAASSAASSGGASAASSAVAECAVPTERPGHQVLLVVAAGPAELTAGPARFSCGSARYEPAGSPVHYGFAAAGVTATLVDGPRDAPHDTPAAAVPLDELIAHLDDCLAEREPAEPYGCHGNAYDVVLDSHGRIMRIGEVGGPSGTP
ncbi:hypothetical protein [Kitasatospora sp. NPDC096204]|uniref:hypothetical protein n=1 Tax=Kitasatospora sp. NPDC096204 TaxID=3364094 RepID=UPI00382D98B3